MNQTPRRTPLYERHLALKAKMVDFAGWNMPIMYPSGIIAEHLATRRHAGLFDVSHMGRFSVAGPGALPFLQYALSSNVAALDVGQAHYAFLSNDAGGAVDEAYVYRVDENEYWLVVNAVNREKDWAHLQSLRGNPNWGGAVKIVRGKPFLTLEDRTDDLAMLSLQGPASRQILAGLLDSGRLPEPRRGELSRVRLAGISALISRTGYAGEPLGFELVVDRDQVGALWDLLLAAGATPVGLGARDTLRLEASLPLYGHELGTDPEGREIPIMASPLAANAVSFSPLKGEFMGRAPLLRQYKAYVRLLRQDYSLLADLPRLVRPLAV
ncbi:MAG: glycine cleavage system protein T, partial [Thermoleophilia bacterium]|nr:glycine cleavage system protein T [Thermoleophilia bacterium]